MIDPRAVVAGDVLIGLPSSGLHSNGFSLARKVLLERGRLKLAERVPELGRSLGAELLEPTRIYAKIARKLFAHEGIKGAAHITGGGITGNLPRVLPPGRRAVLQRGSWPVPPIFAVIQRIGSIPQAEMDRTFNNGLGMILVMAKEHVNSVRAMLKKMGERSFVVGEIRNGTRGARLSD
jgi:phosphoribosylformylglycinamidine cyclo-ligase